MSNIIIPGDHGVGTVGYVPTRKGYEDAADALVRLHDEGRYVDVTDYDVRRVMEYHRASSIEELKVKRRGW